MTLSRVFTWRLSRTRMLSRTKMQVWTSWMNWPLCLRLRVRGGPTSSTSSSPWSVEWRLRPWFPPFLRLLQCPVSWPTRFWSSAELLSAAAPSCRSSGPLTAPPSKLMPVFLLWDSYPILLPSWSMTCLRWPNTNTASPSCMPWAMLSKGEWSPPHFILNIWIPFQQKLFLYLCKIRLWILNFHKKKIFNRYYKAEGKLIPEIHSVAEFMAAQLGDCSGDSDKTFMTLRVGNRLYRSTFKWLATSISRILMCALILGYWKHGFSCGTC